MIYDPINDAKLFNSTALARSRKFFGIDYEK
jgi:hypothetical protein